MSRKRDDERPSRPSSRFSDRRNDETKPRFRKDAGSDKGYRAPRRDAPEPDFADDPVLQSLEQGSDKRRAPRRDDERSSAPRRPTDKGKGFRAQRRPEGSGDEGQRRPYQPRLDSSRPSRSEGGFAERGDREQFRRKREWSEDRGGRDNNRVPRDRSQRPAPVNRGEERIARVLARVGLCSRREAEEWIAAGRVSVNGEVLSSPAVNVSAKDTVIVDGKPLPERERTRLWLFHKPRGLVTTTHDPEGRPTIFDNLPTDLPRVVTIGRLDINTEGLLLLTNDGGLARVLALPATGWLRRYRVRAHGHVDAGALERLRDGITVDGIEYGPIEAVLDRVQGDNTWLTVSLREGKNREVKNVLGAMGLDVNRLIRVSFGPFQLGEMPEGDVEEVKTRVLQEQLGEDLAELAAADFARPVRDDDKPERRMSDDHEGSRQRSSRPPERKSSSRFENEEEPRPKRKIPFGSRARTWRDDEASQTTPIRRPKRGYKGGDDSADDTSEAPREARRSAPVTDRKGRRIVVSKVERSDPDRLITRGERVFEERDERRFDRDDRGPRPFRSRDGDDNREQRGPRPFRSRDGDDNREQRGPRPFRSRDGDDNREQRAPRPFRSRDGDDNREQRGPRPFRSRDGDDNRQQRGPRPFRSRDGDDNREQRGPRPFRSRDGDDNREQRGPRPFRSRDGDDNREQRGPRPFRSRDGDDNREQRGPRPFRSRDGDDNREQRRPRPFRSRDGDDNRQQRGPRPFRSRDGDDNREQRGPRPFRSRDGDDNREQRGPRPFRSRDGSGPPPHKGPRPGGKPSRGGPPTRGKR